MKLHFWILLLPLIGLAFAEESYDGDYDNSNTSGVEDGKDWNELIFTQMWGYSSCLEFKEHTGGTCRYEDKPSIWSIHGIWPTEVGTMGPFFCTKVEFNKTAILPILNDLNNYWYEINEKKDGTYFWTHEWTKHGSCAIQLEAMDSELKYFKTGLELRNEYDLYSILKDAGIIPQARRGYSVGEISKAIETSVGAKPYIQCLVSKESGVPVDHLLAVELCLDKSFKPVDCSAKSKLHAKFKGVAPCSDDHLVQYTDKFTSWTSKTKKNEL